MNATVDRIPTAPHLPTGVTRRQLDRLLAEDTGEPRERRDPPKPEPESHCVPCGWADSGGPCECYDGVPRC